MIGHTDADPVNARSNLDSLLSSTLSDKSPRSADLLRAGSNVDLGLMRAVALRQEWNQWLVQHGKVLPRQIAIRCYSAAHGILPSRGDFSEEEFEAKARRIEIRFTQLNNVNEEPESQSE